MSAQRSVHGATRQATTLAPFQAHLSRDPAAPALRPRLFSPVGPGALNHAVTTRVTLMRHR